MTVSPWEVRRLTDVAEVRTGFAKNTSVTVSQPVSVHYLRVANVQDGFLDLSDVSRIDVSRSDLQRFAVLPGDVLMNEGGDLDKLGRGAIWSGAFDPCIHQNHVFVVRCTTAVRPAYLRMWSSCSVSRRYFLVAGKQTTNLASISKTALSQMPVAVPPLHEQDAIAEALSDADALLAELDRLIAKKRDLKQAAMQQLLTGRIRLPGYQGEWTKKRLGQICEIAMGRTPPRLDPAMWGEGHVWLSIADLTAKVVQDSKEQITALAATSMAVIPKGTLLMSFKLSIGRLCFAGCDLFTNEAICSFNKLQANAEFLFYQLGRTDFSLYGKQAVKGYTLNKESLNLVEVSLPPADEQAAIAAVISDLDAELAALESRRNKTRALKQAMMQELLTGRIRLI